MPDFLFGEFRFDSLYRQVRGNQWYCQLLRKAGQTALPAYHRPKCTAITVAVHKTSVIVLLAHYSRPSRRLCRRSVTRRGHSPRLGYSATRLFSTVQFLMRTLFQDILINIPIMHIIENPLAATAFGKPCTTLKLPVKRLR